MDCKKIKRNKLSAKALAWDLTQHTQNCEGAKRGRGETEEMATESSRHLSSPRGFRTLKDFDFLALNETLGGMLCATR